MKRLLILLLLLLILATACASGDTSETDNAATGEAVVTVFRSPT